MKYFSTKYFKRFWARYVIVMDTVAQAEIVKVEDRYPR